MKVEVWMFVVISVFMVLITPTYYFVTTASEHGTDWTGTFALIMTTALFLMLTLYLGFHAARMDARPEDREDAEIADGAGELGFFPPYSWWPLWCGLTLAFIVTGAAFGAWWLCIIAGLVGVVVLIGWQFEYYRGQHAH